jgi:hypothetical protein
VTGGALLDSLLLVVAIGALLAGAGRVSARLTDEPLPRALAAVVVFGAAAVVEALLLGLLGLSGSPAALTGLAVLSGLLAWVVCPTPVTSLVGEMGAAVAAARWPVRGAAGAAIGLLGAVAAIQLRRPILGQDAVTYHLPEVIGYVQSGHAGRIFGDFYGLPVGNYPITEEVLLSWFTGISHGYAALMLTTLATVPLLMLAGWVGLGELDVPPALRYLALAGFVLVPLVCEAWVQPGTDLQATTWLVCCAALCLAARRSPALLAGALVAAGLALGTKTTVATWSVVVLAVALWFGRGALRSHWRALLAGLMLGVACGLTWYLRNWVEHGSPLWPFSSFPHGDPRPAIINYLTTSLLQSFHRTLLDHLHPYASALSGGAVLVLGGILCGIPGAVVRRRRVMIAALVVLLGTIEYAAGPITGLPPTGGLLVGVVGSTLRYLMPVFAAGTVALALAAADPAPLLRWLGRLGIAGVLVWDLTTDLEAKFHLAFDGWLWVGVLLGFLTALAAGPVIRRAVHGASPTKVFSFPAERVHRERLARAGAPRVAVALLGLTGSIAVLVLAAGSHHFTQRHAATLDFAQGVGIFLDTQPGYLDTDVAVASSKTGMGQLAGDRLQHPLSVIPQHATCQAVARLHATDYLVVEIPPPAERSGLLKRLAPAGNVVDCVVAARWVPAYDDGDYAVYAPSNGA